MRPGIGTWYYIAPEQARSGDVGPGGRRLEGRGRPLRGRDPSRGVRRQAATTTRSPRSSGQPPGRLRPPAAGRARERHRRLLQWAARAPSLRRAARRGVRASGHPAARGAALAALLDVRDHNDHVASASASVLVSPPIAILDPTGLGARLLIDIVAIAVLALALFYRRHRRNDLLVP